MNARSAGGRSERLIRAVATGHTAASDDASEVVASGCREYERWRP